MELTPKGSYFNTLIWEHPRGEAEYAGDRYLEYLGVSAQLSNSVKAGAVFNEIRVPFYILDGGEVQTYTINVYVRHFGTWDSVKSIDSLTLVESFTIDGTDFNNDPDGFQVVTLSEMMQLNPNDSLVVLCMPVSGSIKLGVRAWTDESGTAPYRPAAGVTNDANGLDAGKSWTAIYNEVPVYVSLAGLLPREINKLKGINTNLPIKLTNLENDILALQATQEASQIIVWQHSRGDAEEVGSNYSNYLGVGVTVNSGEQAGVSFDEIRVPFYTLPAGEDKTYTIRVAYKPFGDWTSDRQINSLTTIEDFTVEGKDFNSDPDGFQVITLSSTFALNDNHTLVILAICNDGVTQLGIRNWALAASSTPTRTSSYYISEASGLDAGKAWVSGFYCVPPILSLSTLLPIETIRLKGLSNLLPNMLYGKLDKPVARLAIPQNIYVPIDTELNIWNDALVLGYDTNTKVQYSGDAGATRERGFRFTPAGVDTYPTIVYIKDQNNVIVDKASFTINAVAKNNGSGTKQILVLGDSLVVAANGSVSNIPVTELRTLINTDGGFTPLFLGTQGSAPNRHEGYGGYSYSHFIGTSSPFYDGARINFKDWMADNSNFGGSDTIDFVCVQLGVNDVSASVDGTPLYVKVANIETIINNIKTLVDDILDATYGYPSCKIILNLPPISCSTKDPIGSNDGDKQNRELLIRMLWERMIEEFDEGAYSAQVTLAIGGLMIDRTYGYQRSLTDISARETSQVYEHINYVHPYDSGYKQLADAFYSVIRGLL